MLSGAEHSDPSIVTNHRAQQMLHLCFLMLPYNAYYVSCDPIRYHVIPLDHVTIPPMLFSTQCGHLTY